MTLYKEIKEAINQIRVNHLQKQQFIKRKKDLCILKIGEMIGEDCILEGSKAVLGAVVSSKAVLYKLDRTRILKLC